jgi:Protein of unknown function (DUF3455)
MPDQPQTDRGEKEGSVMRRLLSAGLVAAVAGLQPVSAQQAAIDLPTALNPQGLAIYLDVTASGVQVYHCAKNAAGAWAWTFKAPEATLSDRDNKPLGKHYAGPTWEGLDGGKVVGAVKATMPAPTANDIPWLLLDIKSREGAGRFSEAKGIIRIGTKGGVAPAQGCDEANAGQENRVPYTASYLFLK